MERASLHLALSQFAPCLGDPAANVARITNVARSCGAQLLLTPELSVTGYDLRSEAQQLAIPVRVGEELAVPGFGAFPKDLPCAVVLGVIERGDDGIPYNTAALLERGAVRFRHRKIYLPTYGMFDEGRYFGRGRHVTTFSPAPGWQAGLLVCEDFWHPALAYLLAMAGVDLLLVQAAAAGRGVWQDTQNEDQRFASWAMWERIALFTAQQYGIYVALANRSGVEDGVTFAGGSLLVSPAGKVLAQAPDSGDCLLHAELTATELERARTPFSHLRDEDPALVVRELHRLGW